MVDVFSKDRKGTDYDYTENKLKKFFVKWIRASLSMISMNKPNTNSNWSIIIDHTISIEEKYHG
ncbi:hypothetical protein bcgnr5372_45750 [Bacillus luti]